MSLMSAPSRPYGTGCTWHGKVGFGEIPLRALPFVDLRKLIRSDPSCSESAHLCEPIDTTTAHTLARFLQSVDCGHPPSCYDFNMLQYESAISGQSY